MTLSRLAQLLGATLMLVAAGLCPAAAQTVPEEALRLIASRSVGMPEATFEVSRNGAVLTVKRVNSTMNASSHQGRNNESAAIAKAITGVFAGNSAQYSGIQSISVDYVERAGAPAHDKLIDRIEFRKNAAGKFE
jgi:hypothetical protein